MSNTGDDKGRRGLFRRARPSTDKGAGPSTRPPSPRGPEPKRSGDMFSRRGREDAWSSSAWDDDGWDDDFSDRSRRSSIRPAADPKPEAVDAWLTSEKDNFDDVTRDMAVKWSGKETVNTAPFPVGATWDESDQQIPIVDDTASDALVLEEFPVEKDDFPIDEVTPEELVVEEAPVDWFDRSDADLQDPDAHHSFVEPTDEPDIAATDPDEPDWPVYEPESIDTATLLPVKAEEIDSTGSLRSAGATGTSSDETGDGPTANDRQAQSEALSQAAVSDQPAAVAESADLESAVTEIAVTEIAVGKIYPATHLGPDGERDYFLEDLYAELDDDLPAVPPPLAEYLTSPTEAAPPSGANWDDEDEENADLDEAVLDEYLDDGDLDDELDDELDDDEFDDDEINDDQTQWLERPVQESLHLGFDNPVEPVPNEAAVAEYEMEEIPAAPAYETLMSAPAETAGFETDGPTVPATEAPTATDDDADEFPVVDRGRSFVDELGDFPEDDLAEAHDFPEDDFPEDDLPEDQAFPEDGFAPAGPLVHDEADFSIEDTHRTNARTGREYPLTALAPGASTGPLSSFRTGGPLAGVGAARLITSTGVGLITVAALRMLGSVGSALGTTASDEIGSLDAGHRIGLSFSELGATHGALLAVGIALLAIPQLFGRRLTAKAASKTGLGLGLALVAAVVGVVGGILALRLELRTIDAQNLATNSGTLFRNAANVLATSGTSLVAMIAALRTLGLDESDQSS